MSDIHMIGVALSPLLILILAGEISSTEQMYGERLLSRTGMTLRILCFASKLLFTAVVPLALGWAGAVLLLLANLVSAFIVIRDRHSIETAHHTDDACGPFRQEADNCDI